MSLRARLACALVLVAAVLVVAGGVLLGVVRRGLLDQVDRQLLAAGPIAFNPLVPSFAPPPQPGTEVTDDSALTELVIVEVAPGGSTRVVLGPRGDGAPAIDAAALTPGAATGPSELSAFDLSSKDGGTDFRAVAAARPDGTLAVVALPLDRVEDTFAQVRLGLLLAGVVALAALALAGWWVERLGVRPIKRVTAAAVAVAAGRDDVRVEPQPAGTEAAQLAEAFNVMVDARAASDRRLRRFAADASHELRTPLATVAGVLELQRSGAFPSGPELDDALRRAAQETTRMTGLVDDLLLLARLGEGRPLAVAPVDLAELVRDVAVDAAVRQGGRTLTTELGPALVLGDDERLRQVVTNLVDNALAHTPDDGAVVLRTATEDGAGLLEVRDDGPGLSADEAAHVFDAFYRADAGRARGEGGATSGGSGLGLAIVASIVAAHDGSVSVTTAPGEGAAFRVALPLAAPDPDPDPVAPVPADG